MKETNRLFVVINRINSVLLLVVFLLAAGLLMLTSFTEFQWRRNRTIEVQVQVGAREDRKGKPEIRSC